MTVCATFCLLTASTDSYMVCDSSLYPVWQKKPWLDKKKYTIKIKFHNAFFISDLSIPLEDNHLSAARSIVLEYHKTLAEKRNLHQGNLEAQPSETIVFLGKNPDTPPSEQASNLDRPLDSIKYLNLQVSLVRELALMMSDLRGKRERCLKWPQKIGHYKVKIGR